MKSTTVGICVPQIRKHFKSRLPSASDSQLLNTDQCITGWRRQGWWWENGLGTVIQTEEEGGWDQGGGRGDEGKAASMCLSITVSDKRERLSRMCHKCFLRPSQVQAEDIEGRECSPCPQRQKSHVTRILVYGGLCQPSECSKFHKIHSSNNSSSNYNTYWALTMWKALLIA